MKDFFGRYKILMFLILAFLILFCLYFKKAKNNELPKLDENYKELCKTKSGGSFGYVTMDIDKKSDVEYLGCYIKKEDGIYDSDNSLIKDVDIDTFKVLGYCYAKDKNHIYYSSEILNDVDYSSFENIEKSSYSAAKDKNNFYYGGEKIDVDYFSFEILNNSFAKDKNFVYYTENGFEKIKDLDIKSTILLNDMYIKDQDSIFCNGTGMINVLFEIKNADTKTFSIFGIDNEIYSYAKDKNKCYNNCDVVPMSECDKISKEKN